MSPALAKQHHPVAICLDLAMPDVSGYEIINLLHQDEELAAIPVIIVSASAEDANKMNLACHCLPKPIDERELLNAIHDLTPIRIRSAMVVEDDPDTSKLLASELRNKGVEVRTVQNGAEALQAMRERRPDLLILDLLMPVMDGFKLLDELSKSGELREIQSVVLSAKDLSTDEKHWRRTLNTPRFMKGECDVSTLVNTVLASSRKHQQV